MGQFLDNIRGIFGDTKALGKAVIQENLVSYLALKRARPDLTEHLLLAEVFVKRAQLFAKVNKMPMADEKIFMAHALKETALMSVLDSPNSAIALGLCTLSKERPDIFAKHPEFLGEYQRLMKPAMDAHAAGTFSDLYAQRNPKLAAATIHAPNSTGQMRTSAKVDDTSDRGAPLQQRPPAPDVSTMKQPLRGFVCGDAAMFFLRDVPSTNRETIIPKVVASSFKDRPEMTIVVSAQRIFSDKPPYLTIVASKPEWGVLDGPTERFFDDDEFFLREAIWQIRQFQGLTNQPVVEIDLQSKSPLGVFDK